MFRTIRLGRLLGFEVTLAPSFLLVLLVVLVATGGLTGVAIALLGFASVLVHELGHAVVARRRDVAIERIELGFFGGAAHMIDVPRSARDEIAIAAAGPAVSFAVAGASFALAWLGGGALFTLLASINLVIGAFNLLPALPMDGGRILRAALALRMPYLRATRISVTVARWIAGGLAAVALVQGSLYLVILAGFIWVLGSRELMLTRLGMSGYRGDDDEVEVLPRGWPRSPLRREVRVPGAMGRDRGW